MDTNPLKAFREAHEISQAELARLLGVSRSIAHRWETGDRKIGPNSLAAVSEKTGIPKKELRPDLAEKMRDDGQ
jgi:transcriptional regulator with XRE-family HTH domain